LVAKPIIEFAKQGERDPVRLRDLALKTVRPDWNSNTDTKDYRGR